MPKYANLSAEATEFLRQKTEAITWSAIPILTRSVGRIVFLSLKRSTRSFKFLLPK